MILLVIGIVMMSSASYAWAYEKYGDGLYYAKRQLMFAVGGVAAMIFFMKMDYHNFKIIKLPFFKRFNIAGLMYIIGLALLVAVLIFGTDEGGSIEAKRWLVIGGINFQPSEIAKLALIIYFAYSMEKDGKKMNSFKIGIVKYAVLFGAYAGLLIIEPHVSGTVLLGSIAVAMILCGGANKRQFTLLAVSAVTIVVLFIFWQNGIEGSYIQTRVKSWQDPFADVLNDTWQTAILLSPHVPGTEHAWDWHSDKNTFTS